MQLSTLETMCQRALAKKKPLKIYAVSYLLEKPDLFSGYVHSATHDADCSLLLDFQPWIGFNGQPLRILNPHSSCQPQLREQHRGFRLYPSDFVTIHFDAYRREVECVAKDYINNPILRDYLRFARDL